MRNPCRSALSLHGKHVEASVYHGYRARDELRRIAHQIVYRAAELLGVAPSSEWSLMYHVSASLRVCSVGIGEQVAVLLRDEESRGYGVHSYSLSEFLCAFSCHEFGEVADARLCSCISADACDWSEGCHRREVDDGALSLLHHRLGTPV